MNKQTHRYMHEHTIMLRKPHMHTHTPDLPILYRLKATTYSASNLLYNWFASSVQRTHIHYEQQGEGENSSRILVKNEGAIH